MIPASQSKNVPRPKYLVQCAIIRSLLYSYATNWYYGSHFYISEIQYLYERSDIASLTLSTAIYIFNEKRESTAFKDDVDPCLLISLSRWSELVLSVYKSRDRSKYLGARLEKASSGAEPYMQQNEYVVRGCERWKGLQTPIVTFPL